MSDFLYVKKIASLTPLFMIFGVSEAIFSVWRKFVAESCDFSRISHTNRSYRRKYFA